MAKAQVRAGVYGRESKAKSVSINNQIRRGIARVEETPDWTVAGVYSDGASAARFDTKVRQDWNRLLADLDAGSLDVIVVNEISRADRDLTTWVTFVATCRTRGVLVHLIADEETMDPRKLSHWKALIDGGVDAAHESEKTSQRTRTGVAEAAVKGGFHGDVPYGYARKIVGERQTKHGPKPVKEQYPHPEHAPVAVEILDRLARNDAINAIVRDLDARGVPGPGGGTWDRKMVHSMAFNVAYIGQRRHKAEVYEGTWPALVSVETFTAARTLLSSPARKTTRPGRLKYLLTYLAAAPCGGAIHYAGAREGRVARYHCVTDGCTSIPAEHADEYVTRAVVKRLSQPDARDLLAPADDGPAERARGEAAALREKLEDARASFLRPDGISATSLAGIERDLAPRIEAADKRSLSATAPMALLELLSAAEVDVATVRPRWDTLPMPARRDVLKAIFAEIRIGLATRRLTRFTSEEDRYNTARKRITFG